MRQSQSSVGKKDAQNPRGKAIKLHAITSYTKQNNICFEGAHEFAGNDVDVEMASSFLQETIIPTRQMQHYSSTVLCPAAGLPPGSVLLAPFPSKHFVIHMHIRQVGERVARARRALKYFSSVKREVGGLFFVKNFSFYVGNDSSVLKLHPNSFQRDEF